MLRRVVVGFAISAVVWGVLRFVPSDVGSGAVGWEVGVAALWDGLSVTVVVAVLVSEGRLLSGSRVVESLALFAYVFADGLAWGGDRFGVPSPGFRRGE